MTRAFLVLACAIALGLLLVGLRQGWRNRGRRQAGLGALPAAPAGLGAPLLEPQTGLYVGTTYAASWQDRVVHAGLGIRAAATASLHSEGVLIDRQGADAIFLPAGDVIEARLAPGLAGTVVGAGGLLVVQWRLGDAVLDTGFRADDKTSYPSWVRAISKWVSV
jgi:hypothetical protein